MKHPWCPFLAVSAVLAAVISRSVDEGRLKIDTVRVGVSYFFNSNGLR